MKDIIKKVISAATSYKGDESSFNKFWQSLLTLENAIKNESGLWQGTATDPEKEKEFTQKYSGTSYTLHDLIDLADQSKEIFLKKLLSRDKGALLNAELADITVLNSDLVFLPPEVQESAFKNGEGEFNEPEFRDRIYDILNWLTNTEFAGQKIHLDQIIINRGAVLPQQMRKSPYCIIDVIPWKCQIAVCNQVGEATYFIPCQLNAAELAVFGKTQLQEKFGAIQITMNARWQENIVQILSGRSINQEKRFILKEKSKLKSSKVPFTKELREELKFQRNRTNLGPKAVYRLLVDANKCPEDLTHGIISTWTAKTKENHDVIINVDIFHYSRVLEIMQLQPDARPIILLDTEKLEKLVFHMIRTDQKATKIIASLKKTENMSSRVNGGYHQYMVA